MYVNQIRVLLILLLPSFFILSCAKDNNDELEQTVVSSEDFRGDRRGGGQGNNGPDEGPGGRPDSQVDNDLIISWIDLFLELERFADGMRPNASARALAYINLAAYETAVNVLRNYQSNSGQLPGFSMVQLQPGERIDLGISLNACYRTVFEHFLLNVPGNLMSKIGELEASNGADLNQGVPSDLRQFSIDWGQNVANQVIAYSQTDQQAETQITDPQPISYVPPTGDGYWTFSAEPERALYPYWGSVRTFVVHPDQTTSLPPLTYSTVPSSPYYQEMVEVYEANNNARAEDGEQLWIAEFWSDDVVGTTFGPPSRQFSIANQLIEQRNLSIGDALYLNLKLGFSLNDAAVSTWKYKYEHMVMRPSVFIHEFMDPAYQTNLYRLIPWPNPTFPGYPSGHSCFASAAAGVFIDFFGDRTNFTDRSHAGRTEFRGAPRSFRSFKQMAAENAYSRIPLGVHIRMDCTEGLRLGYEISDAINEFDLRTPRS